MVLLLLLMIVTFFLSSCTTEYISPEQAQAKGSSDILVYFKDETKIFFDKNNYTFTLKNDGKYLSGKGRKVVGYDYSQTEPFEGEILVDKIDKIEINEFNRSSLRLPFATVLVGLGAYYFITGMK